MGTLPAIVGITAGGEWVEVVPARREWTCLLREIRISMGHGIDERMLGLPGPWKTQTITAGVDCRNGSDHMIWRTEQEMAMVVQQPIHFHSNYSTLLIGYQSRTHSPFPHDQQKTRTTIHPSTPSAASSS